MAAETRDITSAFARAMLAVADASGRIDAVEDDLRNVAETYQASADLREFLSRPGLEGGAKRGALEALLDKRVDPIVLSNLGLLAEQGHGRLLAEVVHDYIAEAAGARGSLTAEVTTAVELAADQAERIQAALAQRTGRAVVLRTTVDPAIVGGVVVRLGDEVIDDSIRNRINRLRGTLAAT